MRTAFFFLLLIGSAAAIRASSRVGKELLSRSRRLDNEPDLSWMPDYSIQFQSCHSLLQVAPEGGGGGGEGESQLYTQHLVEYELCPTSDCQDGKNCRHGAKYIVNMREFVQLYRELKQEELEQACEAVNENCNCENANDDDVCLNQCYTDAGLEDCIEDENGDNGDEDIERYLECEELEMDNNNNNNYNYNNDVDYYREYFVGPYCSANGKNIYLGVFYDQGCTVAADANTYTTLTNGGTLKYESTSLVESDCISCQEPQEDDGNNNNNGDDDAEPEIRELCEELYEQAGKCESSLETSQYHDETACNYINNVLPRLESASRGLGVYSGPSRAAVVFAWLFGILAVGLGVWAFLLYRRLLRYKVGINSDSQTGTLA